MGLRIENSSFKNSETLLKLIKLYNAGRLTDRALSLELTTAAQEIIPFGNDIFVEIIEGKTVNGKNFGVSMLPQTNERKFDLYLYIDKNTFSIFDEAQVLVIIADQIANYMEISREFVKFNLKKIEFDISLSDALIEALKIYKLSLKTLHKLPNAEKQLSVINTEADIEKIIDRLENEELSDEHAKEIVTTENLLPSPILHAAENMVKNKLCKKEDEKVGLNFTAYEGNGHDFFYNKIREKTDKTYPMYQIKNIPHNYEPDSNQ